MHDHFIQPPLIPATLLLWVVLALSNMQSALANKQSQFSQHYFLVSIHSFHDFGCPIPNASDWSSLVAQTPEQTQTDEELEIQPEDSWDVVVAKAISLRQLGRIDEAVAAFSRYGQMFAATDSTAELYSQVAQRFTQQVNALGLEGGVYIYELVSGGSAVQAGLRVGDIVIEYNGQPIANMNDLVAVRESAPQNQPLGITYLRMRDDGEFQLQTATVTSPMRAGFMPI